MGEQEDLGGGRARPRRLWLRLVVAAAVAVVLAGAGAVVYGVQLAARFNANVHRSDALSRAVTDQTQGPSPTSAPPALAKDTNILIMGLDSRVDQNGQPLPPEVQNALHAGDDSVGFYNANVLMLVHIPADGSQATALSIPRDDYVEVAGVPDGAFMAKIKEAYSYGFAAEQSALLAQGRPNDDSLYQSARDAGRAAQIATVAQFLGVPIDHFVEITMAAFYQVALAIQPITVCVNRDTRDTFSGADFRAGVQQINAQQAMAFVRQRRDTADPAYDFTDLDRTRRQQAFVASVLNQLSQTGTFTNLPRMEAVLDAVSSNMAVDRGLDLLLLAQQARSLTGGSIAFTTLPIVGFGTSPEGASVNLVDPVQVRAAVQGLLAPPSRTTAPSPAPAATSPTLVPTSPPDATAAATAEGTQQAPSPAPSPAPTYANWEGALRGGGVPCVK
jgi:LCP family protein required for cell wall assembly